MSLETSSLKENKIVVYTKKGDKGETSLYNGKRLKKSHIYFDTLGNLDKLNCWIGQAWTSCDELPKHLFECNEIKKDLSSIQSVIFDISSYIATPPDSSDTKLQRVSIDLEPFIDFLESSIDSQNEQMPALKNFIMPRSKCVTSGMFHMCRVECRSCERDIIKLMENTDREDLLDVVKFMNRLSDYFFQAARFINFLYTEHTTGKGEDEIYVKNKNE